MIVEIRDEVVALSGNLRRNQWPTLLSAVNVRLRHHPAGIVVDGGGLLSLTPEGAETFRDAAQHIARSSARIVVANLPPDVMRVLRQVPNLRSQLPLAPTVAEARASLGLHLAPRHHQAGDTAGDIVAGLLGTSADPHAVSVACRLGQSASGGRVHLVYLLQVPRHMPLLSPLGSEEEAAGEALEGLNGAVRAAGLVPVRRVERTRHRATRLVEVAQEVHAEAIVFALPADGPEELTAMAEDILARAGCSVVVNRLAFPEAVAAPVPAVSRAARQGAR